MLRAARKRAREALANERRYDNDPNGKELREHLKLLWAAGKITAASLTTLAFRIKNAGGRGIDDLSQDPNFPGRNASRKLSRAFRLEWLEENLLMQVPLPKHQKQRRKTVFQDSQLLPFYEHLHRMFAKGDSPFMTH
eukprot:3323411-Lingulodinium_polyedra.AAC.1